MSSPHRHCTSSEIPATVGDTISLPRGGTIREIFSLFSAYCIVKWFLSSALFLVLLIAANLVNF